MFIKDDPKYVTFKSGQPYTLFALTVKKDYENFIKLC